MKKLNNELMSEVSGGSNASAIIGGLACGAIVLGASFMTWGVAGAIFGPTCVGMIIGTVVD
jgi:hypothetical protein